MEKELLGFLCSISWSHHLEILSKTISNEERLYYTGITIRDKLTVRELRRQIESALFERQILSNQKLQVQHHEANKIRNVFKDTYVTEFSICRSHILKTIYRKAW